ncbi:ATPase with role in protein import into the ER, partial [Ceratobasidium sp. 392]
MVHEAEKVASEDETHQKRIEALNVLRNFELQSQLSDQESPGGKISDEDKKTILVEEKRQSATSEDLEKLQEAQAVVDPTNGKLH